MRDDRRRRPSELERTTEAGELDRRTVAAMKEIVLVTLAMDTETGEIDPKASFMVNSPRRGPRYNRPYEDEPGVIEQFRPGECQARFEAEWNDENGELDIRQASGRRLINPAARDVHSIPLRTSRTRKLISC